jgi:hypothetical protein
MVEVYIPKCWYLWPTHKESHPRKLENPCPPFKELFKFTLEKIVQPHTPRNSAYYWTTERPRSPSPLTHWTERCVSPRGCTDDSERRTISCPYRETNHDHYDHESLHQPSYPGFHRRNNALEQALSYFHMVQETVAKFGLHKGNTKFSTQNEEWMLNTNEVLQSNTSCLLSII